MRESPFIKEEKRVVSHPSNDDDTMEKERGKFRIHSDWTIVRRPRAFFCCSPSSFLARGGIECVSGIKFGAREEKEEDEEKAGLAIKLVDGGG